jgi:outer membrane protein assembly factor BamB
VKSFDAGRPIVTQLRVDGGTAYFGDDRGGLHAVGLRTLDRPWMPFAGDNRVTGAIAISPECAYFGTAGGWVYAVDRKSGTLAWKYEIGHEVRAGTFYDGRYVCAGAADGYVYAFDEFAVKAIE